MKLTDFVVGFLAREGIRHVFGVTGGAVVHLFDSVYRHPNIEPIFTHHEQAASFAAEAYSRVSNNLGVAFVTTGPGGTNAITGLCAAWLDSVPCVFISGQTRIEHTNYKKPMRQCSSQHIDIVSVVSHLAKYAVMVEDPSKIKYYLQKAVFIARSGRPGPVWIDIPLNFQWMNINPDKLPNFTPEVELPGKKSINKLKQIDKCVDLIIRAKRPLFLAGYGVRLAKANEEFIKVIDRVKAPFLASWNASDIVSDDNRFYIGRPGIASQRGANLALQNCDLIISIGSHLCMTLTGNDRDAFAREAKRIVVDIDPIELKNSYMRIDLPIEYDAKEFLVELSRKIDKSKLPDFSWWCKKCLVYKQYNFISDSWKREKKYINPYGFLDILSDELGKKDIIIVDGGGTIFYTAFQALKLKRGQRLVVSSGIGAMGSALPESLGACFANNKKRIICLYGDGSLQFNIHELQTIKHHKLPIKIFVLNNDGYLAIRQTQERFLEGRYIGSQNFGGLSLPNYQKVAKAYGIKSIRVSSIKKLREKIRFALNHPGPIICELIVSRNQPLISWIGSDKNKDGTASFRPLEDMEPFLDRKEFRENMIVKPLPVSVY